MIGLGCMRLSTEPDRDGARAAAVIAAAIAAGVELLDTSDAYCHDDSEAGHNELLLSAAQGVRIVTKGGLVRPDGTWVPNGRGRHLAAAARASRDRLGVAAIDLYLLHAIDPKTPLATSVRALAKLRDDGVARAIGLSNVTPTQLDEACALTKIDAVEVELHPWNLDAIRGGLVARCADRGIDVLAHRPLGGPAGVKRATRDPVLRVIAARHAATPAEIVLAWLRKLGPITPLPGATRVATATSAVRGQRVDLDDDARRVLREHFLDVRAKTVVRAPPRDAPRGSPATGDLDATPRSGAEIVMILGMPAAGKSTLAEDHVARGYSRFNRDGRGGSLLDLARALDGELARGEHAKFVVDNTYPTRASRAPIVEVARRHGASVRCIVVDIPIEQAQAHAVHRILDRHGSLDAPGVAKEIRPGVQFRWRRDFESPNVDEGFASIETLTPPRRHATPTVESEASEASGPANTGDRARSDARPTGSAPLRRDFAARSSTVLTNVTTGSRESVVEDRGPDAHAHMRADLIVERGPEARVAVGADLIVERDPDARAHADSNRSSTVLTVVTGLRESVVEDSGPDARAHVGADLIVERGLIAERGPEARAHVGAGLIVELDGVVWAGRPASAAKIDLRPGVAAAIAPWGAHVVGATVWRPGATVETIAAMAARLSELLGIAIDVRYCPHPAGPPTCWCRKPLPGLGIAIARDHRLDLAHVIHLGRGPADRGFATRVGVRFVNVDDGWPTPSG